MKTSISAGYIIADMLSNDETLQGLGITDVFPIVSERDANLPYISYQRTSMSQQGVKTGMGADTAQITVTCFAAEYEESLEIAEAVRAALDGKQAANEDMRMRSCFMDGSSENWADDAYIQELVFNVKI